MEAGKDRAAVDEDRRAVEARHGHDATGHVFVAAADGHEAVEALGAANRLDRIGDDFARNERVAHAERAHADAVGDGDGAEDDRLAAGGIGARARLPGELVDVHVAGGKHAPGGGDAHDGLLEIGVLETDGAEHRAVGGAVGAVVDDGGELAEGVGLGVRRIQLMVFQIFLPNWSEARRASDGLGGP
jgi:hypothetical protein